MNILSANQIREWDRYTIENEPISSVDLMERAAKKCVEWIQLHFTNEKIIKIICGKGNNGGDGLAIARMLLQQNFSVSVYILETGRKPSEEFRINLTKLQNLTGELFLVDSEVQFPLLNNNDVVIDCLFGTGLNQPLSGLASSLTVHINQSEAGVISIDMPSGMFADQSSVANQMIRADDTLTFQCLKKGLLVQENGSYFGRVHILDIGLDPRFISETPVHDFFVVDRLIKSIFKTRNVFAHKGNFGHSLLIAGSYGKMGAAVLAAKACLRSGTGLLSCYIPGCGYEIMQSTVPEAMVLTDQDEKVLTELPEEIEKYSVIGIGPGIGTSDATQKLLSFIIRRYNKPLVLDADALNCMAIKKDLLDQLPKGSILTPHPREFDRLFGEHHSDFERLEQARKFCLEKNIVILLKGHHTMIATPSGDCFFNSTGNAGMAKGGSGDVLTGMITALAAQKYEPEHAAILGVYLHGLAGDFAADQYSREAMTASDIIQCLSQAFLQLR